MREILQGELDLSVRIFLFLFLFFVMTILVLCYHCSYNEAFQNISSSSSILAGFSFSGLLLDPFSKEAVDESISSDKGKLNLSFSFLFMFFLLIVTTLSFHWPCDLAWLTCESFFYFFCFAATVVSLLTV
jgi:hypothetical protein